MNNNFVASLALLFSASACMFMQPADAATKTIVLGDKLTAIKQPTKPGEFDLELVNVLPKHRYSVEAETRAVFMALPEMFGLPSAAGDDCVSVLSAFSEVIENAKTEEDIAKGREVALKAAKDENCKQNIAKLGTAHHPGPFEVSAGEDLVFSVVREKEGDVERREFGTFTFATVRQQPGVWLTLYGINYIDSGDDIFFSKAGTGTPLTYTVTEATDRRDRDFAPSVYFMWVKERNAPWPQKLLSWNKDDVFGGITAGIGFDFDNPTAFLGYGVGWGYNVLLTAGVSMHKEKRLNGRYEPGDVITENLTEVQLSEETYKPRAYVGIAFRFGSNPFKKTDAPAQAATPTK